MHGHGSNGRRESVLDDDVFIQDNVPRSIHSATSVSKMLTPLSSPVNDERIEDLHATQDVQEYHAMAKARLNDAMVSPIYMCGMAASLDSNDPFYDVFLAGPSLNRDTHIEAEFYVSQVEPTRLELLLPLCGRF